MIKYIPFKLFGLLLISYKLLGDLSGDPGEIFAVKLNQNEAVNSHLIIEKDDKEHLTSFFYKNPEKFHIKNMKYQVMEILHGWKWNV